MSGFGLQIFVLILVLMLNSCAIHKDFPFICFEAGCIGQQFNLKGLKKSVGGKLVTASRKRKAKNKVYSNKELKFDLSEDTLSYNSGDHIIYTKFLILFRLKNKETEKERIDSLMIFYTSEFKDLTEASKVRLEYYLSRLYLFTVKGILIREIIKEKDEHRLILFKRKRTLVKFISQTGIDETKIVFVEGK